MSEIETPQFDVPFRLNNEEPLLLEQDEPSEVLDCVETLLRTPVGFVEEEPEYGIVEPAFEDGPVDIHEIQVSISTWEGRAEVVIEETPEAIDQMIRTVNIETHLRTEP